MRLQITNAATLPMQALATCVASLRRSGTIRAFSRLRRVRQTIQHGIVVRIGSIVPDSFPWAHAGGFPRNLGAHLAHEPNAIELFVGVLSHSSCY